MRNWGIKSNLTIERDKWLIIVVDGFVSLLATIIVYFISASRLLMACTCDEAKMSENTRA